MNAKIRLGISSCLLGNSVRYDGGHKLDRFITETLGRYVEYVPVCPEVECGMPIPRESMRLEGDPELPRLVTTRTKIDKTDQMAGWAKRRVADLEKEELMGFIFKSDSPSSGMERVKVYNESGMASRKGIGLFARLYGAFSFAACGGGGAASRSGAPRKFYARFRARPMDGEGPRRKCRTVETWSNFTRSTSS